jgi:hypothetical protein
MTYNRFLMLSVPSIFVMTRADATASGGDFIRNIIWNNDSKESSARESTAAFWLID